MSIKYWDIFLNSFTGYASYLGKEITHLHWGNYFYWLLGISVFFFTLEAIFPWRKHQELIRKDFYLDAFYMFFNFFIFSLIGFNAVSEVFVNLFKDGLASFGVNNLVAVKVSSLHFAWQLFIMFLVKDFVHFNIHRLLHKIPWLWEFHKVHHSVKEMGFSAHLRFHWMETVVYKTLEYLPLALIGFGIDDFLFVHLFTLAWGHFNHSNFKLSLGPLKYIFNSPQMHIWHHAKDIPSKTGVNFGLTLSIWDYLFKTDYVPVDREKVELGFTGVDQFPKGFFRQAFSGFKK